jgi:hypothetical protein
MSIPTSINLNLPATPHIADPELYEEFLRIYAAIKTLAVGLDDYTGGGTNVTDIQLDSIQLLALIVAIQVEVRKLTEAMMEQIAVVNWAQPGEIGDTTPNKITATELVVGTKATLPDTTVGRFGAGGKAASDPVNLPAAAIDAATTQSLVNSIRAALITKGLGV